MKPQNIPANQSIKQLGHIDIHSDQQTGPPVSNLQSAPTVQPMAHVVHNDSFASPPVLRLSFITSAKTNNEAYQANFSDSESESGSWHGYCSPDNESNNNIDSDKNSSTNLVFSKTGLDDIYQLNINKNSSGNKLTSPKEVYKQAVGHLAFDNAFGKDFKNNHIFRISDIKNSNLADIGEKAIDIAKIRNKVKSTLIALTPKDEEMFLKEIKKMNLDLLKKFQGKPSKIRENFKTFLSKNRDQTTSNRYFAAVVKKDKSGYKLTDMGEAKIKYSSEVLQSLIFGDVRGPYHLDTLTSLKNKKISNNKT
ncbi:MAG: hypothetical protein GY874_05425 [Desulfobacteraceae bacterium]|nr:hypothetical protein [Desulfobacteraceae bacterium]